MKNVYIEINRNRYARLIEDEMQNNGNHKEGLNHFNEIFNLIEKGAEIKYLENLETNTIYCESRLILDQMNDIASEQRLTG